MSRSFTFSDYNYVTLDTNDDSLYEYGAKYSDFEGSLMEGNYEVIFTVYQIYGGPNPSVCDIYMTVKNSKVSTKCLCCFRFVITALQEFIPILIPPVKSSRH